MASCDVCSNFINRPIDSYRPLKCKPITANTREIGGTGAANRREFFFLMKPNTLREYATIDNLYLTPSWLKKATQGK